MCFRSLCAPGCSILFGHPLVILSSEFLRGSYHVTLDKIVNACCAVCRSEAGIQDRVVIQELLKTVAQTNQLDSSTQKDFKGASCGFITISD